MGGSTEDDMSMTQIDAKAGGDTIGADSDAMTAQNASVGTYL